MTVTNTDIYICIKTSFTEPVGTVQMEAAALSVLLCMVLHVVALPALGIPVLDQINTGMEDEELLKDDSL